MRDTVIKSLRSLQNYCESQKYKGWDPFDGLNSKVFQSFPHFRNSQLFRLGWIQFFKRFPVNLRPIFLISKGYNPKGLGLFLSGYCNFWKVEPKQEYLDSIYELSKFILELRSTGWSGSCWGYNFDWQARAFFQPIQIPTVVASSFIGYALLDAYDILKENRLRDSAISIADFIVKDLNRSFDDKGNFSFSYSPLDKTSVYNASLLGSRILSRIYVYSGNNEYRKLAKQSVQFCIDKQNPDGSWYYSPLNHHRWIDNFHTGFNLECIDQYMAYTGDYSYREAFQRGMKFYLGTFFTEAGIPKYYHNKLYPIDLHSTAQLIIACSRTDSFNENIELIDRVLGWTISKMQSRKGFFYFQKHKLYINRIPYIRWTQAWMFLALSEYLKNTLKKP